MSKSLVLLGVLLCLSLTAAAQDSVATLDTSSTASEAAVPQGMSPSDREPWQLGIGFQYQHYSPFSGFNTYGYNTDLTRYLANWFGLEGTAAFGFGSAGPNSKLDAKSFFIGGGPHVSVNNHTRFEPWIHALVGWEHFRFTQTNVLGSTSAMAFMGGGGVDFKIGDRAYWRVQADYIGSHFGSSINDNYSFGTGLVFNF